MPHAPQLALSRARSRQVPLQFVWPAPQVTTQVPPLHDWPVVHATPHTPQLAVVVSAMHAPPQRVVPLGHD